MRHAGIVLIALPEVITTPFGLALILSSHILSRRVEANLNRRLRQTVQQFFTYLKRFSDDGESGTKGKMKHPFWLKERPVTQRHKNSNVATPPYSSVFRSRFHTESGGVFHNIDMQSVSRRYDTSEHSKVNSVFSGAFTTTKPVLFHTVNIETLSRRFKYRNSPKIDSASSGISTTTKAVLLHTVNIEALSRRFKDNSSTKIDSQTSHSEKRLLPQYSDTRVAIPVMVTRHNVNMPSLLRRYMAGKESSSMSPTH